MTGGGYKAKAAAFLASGVGASAAALVKQPGQV
jgi:hypothetical protein